MPKLITSKDDHRERIALWTERVNNIEGIEWPSSFKTNLNINNKYNRFTEYTREWLLGIITNDTNKQNDIHTSEFGDIHTQNEIKNNWWKLAIKRSSSKRDIEALPYQASYDDKKRDIVYDQFLPAYRAIKESFDRRPFWHWLTKHAQYTAERDSLKAIKGIIISLTGTKPSDIDSVYADYCEKLNTNVEQVQEAPQEVREDSRVAIDMDIQNDIQNNLQKQSVKLSYDQQVKNRRKTDNNYNIDTMRQLFSALQKAERLVASNIYAKIMSTVLPMSEALNAQLDAEPNEAEQHKIMAQTTTAIFDKTFKLMQASNMDTVDKLVATQMITNILLVRYSPAGLEHDKFGKYADNYIVKNEKAVRNCMEENNEDCVNLESGFIEVMKETNKALGLDKEIIFVENNDPNADIEQPIIANNAPINVNDKHI
jgi:hypothetical protein